MGMMAGLETARPTSDFPTSDFRLGRPDTARAVEEASREQDDRGEQAKDPLDRDPHQAKRQQNQPHDRVEHQREKRERPAEQKKQQPDEKGRHAVCYVGGPGKFDGFLRTAQPLRLGMTGEGLRKPKPGSRTELRLLRITRQ